MIEQLGAPDRGDPAPGTRHDFGYAKRTATGRDLDVEIDRVAAARYGLNVKDVQDICRVPSAA